jgi:hypothetical protein
MGTLELSTGGDQDDDKLSCDEDMDENDYVVRTLQLQDSNGHILLECIHGCRDGDCFSISLWHHLNVLCK